MVPKSVTLNDLEWHNGVRFIWWIMINYTGEYSTASMASTAMLGPHDACAVLTRVLRIAATLPLMRASKRE